jgi:AbrB family looped-hinge helix DNA binding protein
MNEVNVRLNDNGRIVIPAAIREALGILPGEELVLRVEGDELRITTMRHRIERARQLVRRHVKPGRSLVDELLAERRKAARRE